MFVRINQYGKYQYVEIAESYRDPVTKKPKHHVVQKIGRLDKILAEDPEILDKLKKQVEEMNQKESKKKETLQQIEVAEFLSEEEKKGEYQGYPEKNYGYGVYKKIWEELNIDYILKKQQEKTEVIYDLSKTTFLLTISRLMKPGSKLAAFKGRGEYLLKDEGMDLNHIYRSLDLLAEGKSEIEKYLDKRIRHLYQREVDVAFYDVTTYYFESVEADTLKRFGYSKDKKVNEVQVVMGLFIDKQGIPLGYELFPGNTSDFSTMKTALLQLKERYKIGKIIITADRGLNSKKNLETIRELGFGYVMAYKIRGASDEIKEIVLSEEGYHNSGDGFKYKSIPLTNIIKTGKEKYAIEEKLVITWSKDREKKDACDRQRLIDKSVKLVSSPGMFTSELKKGGKKYIKAEIAKEGIQLDREKIEYDQQFDGYYAVETSETAMDEQRIIEIYKGLWKIEESFRVLKTEFESRPCFVWTESRIRGHFVICFLALILQRLLEKQLHSAGCEASTARIIEAVNSAKVIAYSQQNAKPFYLKLENDPLYDEIIQILGIGKLYSTNSRKNIREITRLQI